MKRFNTWLFFLLLSGTVFSQDEQERLWTLRGYIKDMVTYTRFKMDRPFRIDSALTDNLVHNRLNFHWFGDDRWSAKLELRTRVLYGQSVSDQLTIDNGNDYFNWSYNWQNDEMVFNTILDRAYVRYSTEKWDLTAGRQRINWGVTTAWNVNDIFNVYSIVDFDYEERPGSDAIRFQKYTDYAGGYELAINLADNFEELTMAGMLKWNENGYDFQSFGGLMSNNLVAGLGWAGSIGLAGFKGELTYAYGLDEAASDGLLAAVEVDYSFPNSLYLNGSVLYNGFGADQFPGIMFAQPNRVNDVRSISFTKWSLFFQSSYLVHPLVNTAMMIIYFPDDSVSYLAPVITFNPLTNLDIDLIGQILAGMDHMSFAAYNFRLKYSF